MSLDKGPPSEAVDVGAAHPSKVLLQHAEPGEADFVFVTDVIYFMRPLASFDSCSRR